MGDAPQLTTLGEALVVMDPLTKGPLRFVGTFQKHLGGAEYNVAVGLSRLGHRAGWVGALGNDEFGEEILALARAERVDVSHVIRDPDAPTGLYFKEWRALGQLRVHYYRAGSAASRMRLADVDVDYLLSGEIMHLTGITATLSDGCHDLVEHLISEANERGVPVSFDVNMRRQLLRDRDPREVLGPLAARADLLFLSDDEAELMFGGSDPERVRTTKRDIRAETVVVHRADGAYALHDGVSEMVGYSVDVVDTVGAGDAFVAGFLSGRLRGWSMEECLDLANACGACAVTVPGDLKGLPTEEEVLALRRGLGSRDAER